jgi:hypothetical protein
LLSPDTITTGSLTAPQFRVKKTLYRHGSFVKSKCFHLTKADLLLEGNSTTGAKPLTGGSYSER